VNPATPEGSYHDMQQLLKMWMKRECTIVLDESFLEFEELKSAREYIKEYKKLYIIQSFSKFYSCAGVRIGAIFAYKKSIEKLSKELWNISSLDTHFLQERLCDRDFKRVSKELHLQQKKQLLEILEDSKIFDEVVESHSNFILCYSSRGKELFEYLLKHKILVRSCESFDYLSENWLRFAVKDASSQLSLKNRLDAFKEKNDSY
jgi:threonine-phosphate decarboxylase